MYLMVAKYFSMYDIILVAVPYTHIAVPPLALAVLKGAVESDGLAAKTLDLGMELYKLLDCDLEKFEKIQDYFIVGDRTKYNQSELDLIDQFINDSAEKLANYPSRYLGISIFSFFNHYFIYLLLKRVREISKDRKIVIGGPGASTNPSSTVNREGNLTAFEQLTPYGKWLMNRKLADHVILGDGEDALIEFLNNGKVESKKKHQVNYKNELPYANFDDYDLHQYPGQLHKNQPQIPIFGSKGCVRKCDFCDVGAIQGRFRFRTGSNIVKEILYLADRYGIRDFNFTDSLVNGSLSNFEEWVAILAEHNRNNPDKRITWNGSWICRPIGELPARFYELMAESGCESLTTGFETGSNEVLTAMNKKTNIEAYYYEIEQFSKYNIKVIGLFIIGHWSETWEDFLKTCDLLYNLVPYSRNGVLVGVYLGVTGLMLPNTPADQYNKEHGGIKVLSQEFWWNSENPSLTAKERFFRLLLVTKLCQELKIPLVENVLPMVHTDLRENFDKADSFYLENTQNLVLENAAEKEWEQHTEFLNNIANRNPQSIIDLEFELETSVVTQPPKIQIKFNSNVIFDDYVSEGNLTLKFNVPSQAQNNLTVTFYNKLSKETLLDENNNIVKDTFVMIKRFVVNNINISDDPDFFYNQLGYTENNQLVQAKNGFWINDSQFEFNFTSPFFLDYANKTNKNVEYGAKLITEGTMPDSQISLSEQAYLDEIVQMLKNLSC